MKEIDELIERADDLALIEVERLARKDLASKSETYSFTMAMGTYFFSNKNEILHDYSNKELDSFIEKYDNILRLTGNPMIFTATSKVITDW